MIRIKFGTKQDSINGYYELSTKGLVRSLRGGIYEINNLSKEVLDKAKISYEVIPNEEALNENKAIRNSLTVSI
ncbi:hypothetical protein KKH56_01750 [bacterium]|nr:hypothetical protein [bacterium]